MLTLQRWATRQGPDGLVRYRAERNRTSIDGLPALEAGAEPGRGPRGVA